jgi:hypothetical protein
MEEQQRIQAVKEQAEKKKEQDRERTQKFRQQQKLLQECLSGGPNPLVSCFVFSIMFQNLVQVRTNQGHGVIIFDFSRPTLPATVGIYYHRLVIQGLVTLTSLILHRSRIMEKSKC